MPNWCFNEAVLFNQDSTKIDALVEELEKENPEPFNHLRPRPQEKNEEWYSWNIEKWGTKWDVNIEDYTRVDDNTIQVFFDSAWSPPIELYTYLEHEGWDVSAQYSEEGMQFVGSYSDLENDHYEYDFSDENWRETIPEELIIFGNLDDSYEWYKENLEDEEQIH